MPRTRPPIKNGVDLQLQSACSDENWPVVLRLAEKRARTSKDQYYETLKICAESQLDDPATQFAAVAAVGQYVKDGTVIKDVDALDILEWACQDHLPEEDFSQTLGTLRARAVKAGVKNKSEAIRCLESCLLHWDLVNAQQIAAMMDRTFSQERMFMFWNIVITHLLSTNAQSPPEKKKLYGMLAQKQIERAAQASQNGDDAAAQAPTARTVQSEEEILLLYEVVEQHGTAEDLSKLLSSPSLGPLSQFQKGRKELLLRTVRRYRGVQDWRAVFDLCHKCLAGPDTDKVEVNFLASDWSIWKQFIEAASHLESVDATAGKKVQSLLLEFIKSPSLRPIYRRNVLLARLAAVFTLSKTDGLDAINGQPTSLRLKELKSYLGDQFANSACFTDVKEFVEKLDESGLRWLALNLRDALSTQSKDERSASSIELLSLKIRYFVSTFRLSKHHDSTNGPQKLCVICESPIKATNCNRCLDRIIDDTLKKYQDLRAISQTQQGGTLSELAILTALCYVDAANLPPKPASRALGFSSLQCLYRALAVLEGQLHESPKDSVILLLLVQLHLRVGSASRARILWDDLGVKRTIVDCIAPVLYDRLSTVSPLLLSRSDKRGAELSDIVRSHYHVSLQNRMPRRLIDAFEAESYSSVLKIPEYIENLRTGCTRAMSLVEDARTARCLDGPGGRVLNDPRYTEIHDDVQLCETIDFGSYPSWAMSDRRPVYIQLQLGPSPTNARCHTSLLSEAFHEVLNYKAPAVYKVATASDPTFVLEQMAQVGHSLSTYLRSLDGCVTHEESIYFDLLGLLSGLITLTASLDRASAEETLPDLISSAQAALESLKSLLSYDGAAIEQVALKLSNLHGLTMARDAAQATRLSCQWILSHNEREKERDRSGQSGLSKEIATQLKRLQGVSDEVSKFGKSWVSSLHESVNRSDFRSEVQSLVLEERLKSLATSRTVDSMIHSWKATVKGWQEVRWE